MRVGVIARGENRGLGILTWEVVRHLNPDKVLLVDMGEYARDFRMQAGRFPGDRTTHTVWTAHLDEGTVRRWLDGLDVVYSAETFYDRRMVGWCNLAGIRTVLHAMPEFLRADEPRPTEVWLPTPWRAALAGDHRLMPVPIAADRFDSNVRFESSNGPLRVLHVAGHRAAADRNGTGAVLRALGLLHERVHVTVLCQDEVIPLPHRLGPYVTVESHRPRGDYWTMYDGHDVLLMPRRYGGLSLPVQEAIGAGVVPVMTATEPNDWYPGPKVECTMNGRLITPAGQIRIAQAIPRSIAATLDFLARDASALDDYRRQVRTWADAHSWAKLLPAWRHALEVR
jgi:hypothetical protein